ncbi:MAG TPA: hypothetical protein VJP85_03480 [Candidatus Baltobacteraceae bacterium]|nr:hypothetical protein [Candidatus Baltobacteraceae bacterium]
MQIKFNTYQQMDFTNVWYVLALNTSGVVAPGTTGEPYAFNGNQQQNWINYSFEIIVSQLQGQSGPTASLYQFVSQSNPGGGPPIKVPTQLTVSDAQMHLNANCNGSGTQFCVTIDRHVFSGVGPTATPSPTASPSSSPSSSPAPAIGGVWYINWFTVTPGSPPSGGQVIDAPGTQGPSDQRWLPPNTNYDTTTAFDLLWNGVPPPGWPQVANPAAQISGGEVLNNP